MSIPANMASNVVSDGSVEKTPQPAQSDIASVEEKKDFSGENRIEDVSSDHNLHYDEVDLEPELHARTYIALFSMFMLNLVQVVALQGPPAVVSSYPLQSHPEKKKAVREHPLTAQSEINSLVGSVTVWTTHKPRHGCRILYPSFKQYWDLLSLQLPIHFKLEKPSSSDLVSSPLSERPSHQVQTTSTD